MCGICGSISFDDRQRVNREFVTTMRDTMLHRGPDGGGTWVSPDARVGLGHRRLSIIDLSTAASQPMSNEDDTLWLVFNGEIYNHAEIRRELEQIGGHRWKTNHSDSEMILHAFEQWGIDCLHRFRGMFAFALWDAKQRELWLVRDRIGIKPLYYTQHHGRLNFASEIKALLVDPEQEREVNHEAFFHYLSFLTTPAPTTLFQGIRKLPGGCWLRVRANGDIEERRYWDVWDHTTPLTKASEQEIAERVLAELKTAVALRKVSDVPVGVFLSGGIDSSTNAALFSEGEQSQVKTFSVGYEGEYQSYTNELHYARKMAQLVKADHHEVLLTQEDLLNFLPRMIELQDEPIGDPVCMPVYFVSKLARDNGVIVCQNGEGSDELFWGYERWKTMLSLQNADDLPVPGFVKRAGLAALAMAGKQNSLPYEWLRRGAADQKIFWSGADIFPQKRKESLLSESLVRELNGLTSWEAIRPIYDDFKAKAWEPSNLHWMSYVDLRLRLPELLLMRVDKMTMGVSLEGRVPFLDHKFVELALSIPSAVKTRQNVSKYILKKAVRGVIPDELIDRRKQGFGVPVYEWFFDKLGRFAEAELMDFCKKTDFLNEKAVREMFAKRQGQEAWFLLNFALWHKRFIQASASEFKNAMVQSH